MREWSEQEELWSVKWNKARILKHFPITSPLFHKVLFKCTRGFFKVFLWFQRQSDKISILLTTETLFENLLFISVVLGREQSVSEYRLKKLLSV